MNYKVTEGILDAIRPICDLRNIHILTENKDWKGRPYKSDFVTINESNNIGFEVFEDEIIVFYFTDHCHFEDYTTDGVEEDYITRTICFLNSLFTLPIRYVKETKGKKIKKEEYFFILLDNKEESLAGISSILSFGNPFSKRVITEMIFKYDKDTNLFEVQRVHKD